MPGFFRTPAIYRHTMLAMSVAFASQTMAQESGALEEVVVTAEHRTSTLQDTQISITALSGTELKELGISNTQDLGHIAPNVTMTPFQGGKGGIGVNMRGMGQNETLITFDPAIGVYIDDVLVAKNTGALMEVLDLERVELLRGPQGTLYGRNTMGGTLNFITVKPYLDEFEGRISATGGDYGRRDLKAMLNIPVGDSVAARVAAASINRDGLIENDLAGAPNDELETVDRQAVMAHLKWQATDDLDFLYTYDYSDIDEVPSTPWVTGTDLATSVGNTLEPYSIGYHADRPDSIAVDGEHFGKIEVTGHSLHANYSLSDTVSLQSISAYRDMEQADTADSDGSPLPVLQISGQQAYDQFTQEFRLLGSTARLDYTLGLFYMQEEGDLVSSTNVFGSDRLTFGDFDNSNWAVYGQATYALTDRLSVTAGARYTEEEREMGKSDLAGGVEQVFPDAQRDFDNLSPMASVNFDWTDEVMTYFKVSTGFQSGGFNVRDASPSNFQQGFDEENLLAYELGLKAEFFERVRFNGALWYSDYDDKRVNNFDPETLASVVRNAGVVEIWGAELEMLARLNDYFSFGATFGWTDPEYVEYDSPDPENPGQIIDLKDSVTFPYTPEYTGSAYLDFEYPLSWSLLKARVDWAYKDDYTFQVAKPQPNFQESYELWNARVSLDDIQGPGGTEMRFSLWGKNLSDESYYTTGVNILSTFGFAINLYAEPRTFGVDVEVRF